MWPLGATGPEKTRRRVSLVFKVFCGVLSVTGLAAIGVGAHFLSATGESLRVYTVTSGSLKLYIFMGVYMLLTSLLGIFASLAPLKRKRLVQAYIVLCALSLLIMMCLTVWLWTRTLNIHGSIGDMWRNSWSSDIKRIFEDENKCCGYLNPRDSPVLSSPSCQSAKINYGCYLPVLYYTQIRLRGVYAGFVVFMLIVFAATVTATLQLVFTSDHERVLRSQSHYLLKRHSKNSSAAAALPHSAALPRSDSFMSSLHNQEAANNGWDNDD
ncbi:hypothetical protein GGF44_001799 [Coemansia sp. RSA 1694]|nr:hypothetical protein GGF44_001799 [Coemansia sp. RSA 1694]